MTAQQKEAQKQIGENQKHQYNIRLETLQAESKKLEGEITGLSKNIVARNESLEKHVALRCCHASYINTINNSKINYELFHVFCMSRCEQQKADKKSIAEKQVAIMKQSTLSLQTANAYGDAQH